MGRKRNGSGERIKALARELPDEMRLDNDRMRLLCIAELMRTLTDEAHPLSTEEIRGIIAAKFGENAAPSKGTVIEDLRAIRESGCLGLTIRTGTKGSWCENTRFPPATVRLLLNAVRSSRVLTDEQDGELEEALLTLVSRRQEDLFESDRSHKWIQVEHRARSQDENLDVFKTCGTILEALRQKKKVRFRYTRPTFSGGREVLTGDKEELTGNKEEVGIREETPIALIFASDNYYLESYANPAWRHTNVTRSRVDRMQDVSVSDADEDDVEELRDRLKERMRQNFDSMSGDDRYVVLCVSSDRINMILDHFGFDAKFFNYTDLDDVNATALFPAHVTQSTTFFRWLSGMGGRIRLARPLAINGWANKGPWKNVQEVTQAKLEKDYEELCRGYRAYLAAAAESLEG